MKDKFGVESSKAGYIFAVPYSLISPNVVSFVCESSVDIHLMDVLTRPIFDIRFLHYMAID